MPSITQTQNLAPESVVGQGNVSTQSGVITGPNRSRLFALSTGRTDVQPYLDKIRDARNRQVRNKESPELNRYGIARQPWIFATFDDVMGTKEKRAGLSTPNALVWHANPKSVEWTINQRATESKNKTGSVLYTWRRRGTAGSSGSYYDEPVITFTFQTGNILKSPAGKGPDEKEFDPLASGRGLNNFYRFLELVDRSKITASGLPNLVHILYRSQIFPSMVLTGFFNPQAVVRFSDSADQPNQITGWTASFTVYSTTPKLQSFDQLINSHGK